MTNSPEEEIVHREFDPTESSPNKAVIEAVAEIEDTTPTDLPALWPRIDELIANLFDDPPAPEAQARVTFSYAGYRITMHQDGKAEFVNVG